MQENEPGESSCFTNASGPIYVCLGKVKPNRAYKESEKGVAETIFLLLTLIAGYDIHLGPR